MKLGDSVIVGGEKGVITEIHNDSYTVGFNSSRSGVYHAGEIKSESLISKWWVVIILVLIALFILTHFHGNGEVSWPEP